MTKAIFPINAEQHTELGDHHRMRTKVQVSDTGRLDAEVRTWTAKKTQGFRGQVVVFLLDQAGNILWNTQDNHRYGIDAAGPFKDENSRTDRFTETIPSSVLKDVRKIYIYHRRDPKPIGEILDDISTIVDQVNKTYKIIKNTELAQDIAVAVA